MGGSQTNQKRKNEEKCAPVGVGNFCGRPQKFTNLNKEDEINEIILCQTYSYPKVIFWH